MIEVERGMDQYIKAFEDLKKGAAATDAAWVRRLREEAMASFTAKGFPTVRDEAWRYTDLTAIQNASFVFGPEVVPAPQSLLEKLKKDHCGKLIAFVNGRYNPEASSFPEDIEVTDLRNGLASMPELEAHCGKYADFKQNPFVALNTAFLGEGVLIRIPEGQVLEAPLRLAFIAEAGSDGVIFQPRVLVLAGKGSRATLVEHYCAANPKSYFTNIVSEIVLEEGATIRHYKIQDENRKAFHIASTWVSQGKGSQFSSWALSMGSRLMRNDCRVGLVNEDAACTLSGLYLGDGDQHLDQQTFVDHQKPAGKSRQYFKGLMGRKSRGVFGGKVVVRQGAIQTDATQTNKNLLLSDEARVDTQPQLEIDTDDVKCSHGAAVGQLQGDAVFYLQSRGIGERDAARILARGFVQEVVDAADADALKQEFEAFVNQKLEEQFLEA